jgi:hypothetical protein
MVNDREGPESFNLRENRRIASGTPRIGIGMESGKPPGTSRVDYLMANASRAFRDNDTLQSRRGRSHRYVIGRRLHVLRQVPRYKKMTIRINVLLTYYAWRYKLKVKNDPTGFGRQYGIDERPARGAGASNPGCG